MSGQTLYVRSAMHRAVMPVSIRSINEEKRECEFVASTESPVETWNGREVLRMVGCKLDRYRSNPVFLDTHNGSTIQNVLGSASDVSVEGRELIARMRFSESGKGALAWDLVREGHVKAVSVGYRVNPEKVRRLRAGETSDGAEGPCSVAYEWELYEISLVPVPADERALARGEAEVSSGESTYTLGTITADKATGVVQSAEPATRGGQVANDVKPETPAAKPEEARASSDLPEEVTRRRLLAIFPDMQNEITRCMAKGLDFDAARKALLGEFETRNKPLGTPEPAQQTKKDGLAEITDEVFARSLKAAFGGR